MISGGDWNYPFTFGLCLAFILLVPFAIAGLVVINTGLGRSRSAAHAMTCSLCIVGTSALVYFVCGFKIQGYRFSPQFVGPLYHNLLSQPGFFFVGLGSGFASLAALLGVFSVALACLIPLGAAAD